MDARALPEKQLHDPWIRGKMAPSLWPTPDRRRERGMIIDADVHISPLSGDNRISADTALA
jgi:hypothetical protein